MIDWGVVAYAGILFAVIWAGGSILRGEKDD